MPEENNSIKKKNSIDWLMRGVLVKLGDTFDRLTGRRWTPSSSLATSELSEKLKKLLDIEVKDFGAKGKFVPHNLKLKMQWDKFSTDANEAITKLENELKIAAIDHINDNRYHTYAPIVLQITPDYFTEGVKLLASFDKFDEEKREASVNVTVPQIKVGDYLPELPPEPKPEAAPETFIVKFTLNGKPREVKLIFKEKQRRSVGRTKENDVSIEDTSISKIHAALILNSAQQLLVADTGSTNGTFINGERIAYGRAVPLTNADKVKFGNIEVAFEYIPRVVEDDVAQTIAINETPTETISPSQSNVQTVAFKSDENVSVKTEFVPPIAPPNIQTPVTIAETKFVAVKPEVELPEVKANEPDSTATGDRINYDFFREDKAE